MADEKKKRTATQKINSLMLNLPWWWWVFHLSVTWGVVILKGKTFPVLIRPIVLAFPFLTWAMLLGMAHILNRLMPVIRGDEEDS